MYIYIFWSHGEDGPEYLKATTVRANVIDLANKSMDDWKNIDREGILKKLFNLLDCDDYILSKGDGIHGLMDGWGGLHFQVVKES